MPYIYGAKHIVYLGLPTNLIIHTRKHQRCIYSYIFMALVTVSLCLPTFIVKLTMIYLNHFPPPLPPPFRGFNSLGTSMALTQKVNREANVWKETQQMGFGQFSETGTQWQGILIHVVSTEDIFIDRFPQPSAVLLMYCCLSFVLLFWGHAFNKKEDYI